MQNNAPQILADVHFAEEDIQKAIAMVEAGDSGIGVLHQIIAAKAALSEVNAKIVSIHIENCTENILKSKLPRRRLETLQSLIDLYSVI